MKNIQFQPSADTTLLASLFREAKMGDEITYEDMSKAIGRDVRSFAYASMLSARRIVQRENSIVFGTITGVGIKRIDDGEIVDSMESDRKRIAKSANRSLDKLACADFAKLDDAKRKLHVAMSAQVGAIAMFAKRSTTTKIEGTVKDSSSRVSIGETLKMFSS